ncbi:MAG TPA: hypothetical protein VK858_10850 [Longimicrobiales bacterium]|nr:hypothetical protein [Longimicrobiales bacterium]
MDEVRNGPDDGGMRDEMEHRLMARVAGLEREIAGLRGGNRLLGIALIAALGLSALSILRPDFLAMSGTSDVVQARDFVLVGADGQVRGRWSVADNGPNATLAMQDQSGTPRLTLTVGGDGPGMSFADAAGQNRVALGVLADETSSLVFADRSGETRAVLGMSSGGAAATLVLADAAGLSRIGLGVDATGLSSVLLPETDGDGGEGSGSDDGPDES